MEPFVLLKFFFHRKDNMHGEKLPQITWFSWDEKMEQIACHVIGFISPVGKIALLQGLKFEHNDVLICMSIHNVLICISIHIIVLIETHSHFPQDKRFKSNIFPPPSH